MTSRKFRLGCAVIGLLFVSPLICDVAGHARARTAIQNANTATHHKRTRKRHRRRRVSQTVTTVPERRVMTVMGSSSVADAAVPPSPAPVPPPTQPKTISGGVLNGRAISKPQPAYPPIAKAAHASGTVVVQILVDESGRVISARAVSGHPLLQQAAVSAARQARFSPTLLSGQPVKVSGVITYNFVLQ